MSISQESRAAEFRTLHTAGNILVLPNAWDAASARIVETCGAKAVATSSAAVSWAHGYPDGEALPKATLLSMVAEIVRVLGVPLSVDSEAGFSSDPAAVAEFVLELVRAGAAGINLEDGLLPPDHLAAKIAAIKQACARENRAVFVNARTDVYLRALVPAGNAVEESIVRGRRYREAGADGLFVPGVTDLAAMKQMADAVALPLNVLVWQGLPPVGELKAAGVRRVSAGAATARAAFGALGRAAKQMLDEGRYDAIFSDGADCPNMNRLLTRG
jgi:2-methylisocitrate lyase-like PEP mutase family enzyme